MRTKRRGLMDELNALEQAEGNTMHSRPCFTHDTDDFPQLKLHNCE